MIIISIDFLDSLKRVKSISIPLASWCIIEHAIKWSILHLSFPHTLIPSIFKQNVFVIVLLVYILVLFNFLAIFKLSQVIEAKDITVTHARYVLNFILETLILVLPNILVFPLFLKVLLAVHVQVHLILEHDVDFLLELSNAGNVVFYLGVLSPNFLHSRELLFLKDQVPCVLSDRHL